MKYAYLCIALGIIGFILVFGYGDVGKNRSVGNALLAVWIMIGLPCLDGGYRIELNKLEVKTKKYILDDNKKFN